MKYKKVLEIEIAPEGKAKYGKEFSKRLSDEREYWREKIEKLEEDYDKKIKELNEIIATYKEKEEYYEAKRIVAEYEGTNDCWND